MMSTGDDQIVTQELVDLTDEIRDINESVDRLLNQTYNRPLGFLGVSVRMGRPTTLYQVMSNVQRNLSLTIDRLQAELADRAAEEVQ